MASTRVNAAPPPRDMLVGTRALPPAAYVEFCQSRPADCELSGPNIQRVLAQRPFPSRQANGPWEEAFAQAKISQAQRRQATAVDIVLSDAGLAGREDANGPAMALSAASAASDASAGPAATPQAAPLAWGGKSIQLVESINRFVNQTILPATDLAIYGVADFWSEPITENQLAGGPSAKVYGDCEDYVLEKRRRLVAAGVAPENLSIAIALNNRGALHAVLLVRTDAGEMVLDNLSYWIVTWDRAPYHWLERQVLGRADDWRHIVLQDEGGESAVTRVAALPN